MLAVTRLVNLMGYPASQTPVLPGPEKDNHQGFTPQQRMVELVQTPRMRTFIRCLMVFECIAIGTSQYIAAWTYHTQGAAAAYYATWTRAGEFAVGGLSACFLHLAPKVYARYLRVPGLPKMSFTHRVFLEAGAITCLFGLFFVPMLPLSQHVLLHHYFTWLRIPSTMLVLLPAPASDLQGTEPLPRWAVASRIFHQPILMNLGIMCYGEHRCFSPASSLSTANHS